MQGENWQNQQPVLTQDLATAQSSKENAIKSRTVDAWTPGVVANSQLAFEPIPFQIVDASVGTPAITVKTGVAYSPAGERIIIPSLTAYVSTNPSATTSDGNGGFTATPQSTGSTTFPLTASVTNYVWVGYLKTIDPSVFSLAKLPADLKLFTSAGDGFVLTATTDGHFPGYPTANTKWVLIGVVTTSGSVCTSISTVWSSKVVVSGGSSAAALKLGVAYGTETLGTANAAGASISGSTPATTAAGGTLTLNINGDGAQTITLGTDATGVLVAADIQAKVRALTAVTASNQQAFTAFTAVYSTSYTLTSGATTVINRHNYAVAPSDATIIVPTSTAQRPATYTYGETKTIDTHVNAIGGGTVSALNPHATAFADVDGLIEHSNLDTDIIWSGNIAPADGITVQDVTIGQGIKTDHIQDGAVTLAKADHTLLEAFAVPTGVVTHIAGAVAPVGWLARDGSTYTITQVVNGYSVAALYALIGNTFGGVPGSTFVLPDDRGRVDVGSGTGSGLTNKVLYTAFGEELHILSVAEAPTGLITLNDPQHAHTTNAVTGGGAPVSGSGTSVPSVVATINASSTGITLTDNGGNTGHNNIQPSRAYLPIIKL